MNKMLTIAKILIYATAGFFVIYGGIFTFMPHELAMFITDHIPQPNSASIDFRATYGGLQFAVGLVLFTIMKLRNDHDLALLTVAITLLSMAVGRVYGIWVDENANLLMYVFLVAEIVSGLAALITRKHLLFKNHQTTQLDRN